MWTSGSKSCAGEMLAPAIVGLLIKVARVTRTRPVDGRVEAVWGKFPTFDNQFPRPGDGFLFEVIAKGPVAEHLEERVVIGIEPDVFEIVVLASGTDALLSVCDAPRHIGTLHLAKKDRDELVHARVGKKQIRRIGHQARGGHDRVLFLPEKFEKGVANFSAGHESLSDCLALRPPSQATAHSGSCRWRGRYPQIT